MQLITSIQPFPSLPAVTLRAKPFFICYHPSCDPQAGARTFCVLLAKVLQFKSLLLGHNAAADPGALWTREQLQAYVATAPECREFLDTGAGSDAAAGGYSHGEL